jgi:hypothetical protein
MNTQPEAATAPSRFARSSQMVRCLRENFAYCEKRARDLLFAAVEEALRESIGGGEPPILSRLTREAALRAREAARQSGFAFTNWEIASRAVVNAMLAAGVFVMGNGSAVRPDITAQATRIAGLKKGFRDLTEAYLVELVVRKLGDVTTRDHKALAHALFRQFDARISIADLEDRVVLLLAMLSGRVALREDGKYALRKTVSAAYGRR